MSRVTITPPEQRASKFFTGDKTGNLYVEAANGYVCITSDDPHEIGMTKRGLGYTEVPAGSTITIEV